MRNGPFAIACLVLIAHFCSAEEIHKPTPTISVDYSEVPEMKD
jgi:hypothetical protein